MVQIIRKYPFGKNGNVYRSFISHMVQIIPTFPLSLLQYFVHFISHMVQIIHVTGMNKTEMEYALYIPHGSDNT